MSVVGALACAPHYAFSVVPHVCAAATDAPLDFQMDPDGVGSWNFPEDQGGHRGFNRTHALEVCNNPGTLSVQAKPPPGRGNHPMFPSAICKEYTDEYNWVTTPCKYETELGVPSQYAVDYVEAWCDRCVNPMTGDVDGLTAWSRPALNIQVRIDCRIYFSLSGWQYWSTQRAAVCI